jgi:hypothetical protein
MKGIKVLKRTNKKGVYSSGGMGGSVYTEFSVGQTLSFEGSPALCESGYHFFKYDNFCFGYDYYGVGDRETVYVEIKAQGEIVEDTFKCSANKIEIIRIIPKKEWKKWIKGNHNSGNDNSGNYNSGHNNSGNHNSGNHNSGHRNSGDGNSGDGNSGNRNSGNYNSGYDNPGNHNSGYDNSGNDNSGDHNSGYDNSGDDNSGNYNSGNHNSGNRNSGNRNSGHRNSGYGNSGYGNSGYDNSGDDNSGNYNSGHNNSGNHNSGNRNSGDHNSGDDNSGYYNSGYYNSGWFNRDKPGKIRIFEKEIDRDIWEKTEIPVFLLYSESIEESLKEAKKKGDWKDQLQLLINLPNFDYKIFEDITGISKEDLHEN